MCHCEDKRTTNWMKWIPLIALIIGLMAFSFQIGVLHPWHQQLSAEFAKLSRQIKR